MINKIGKKKKRKYGRLKSILAMIPYCLLNNAGFHLEIKLIIKKNYINQKRTLENCLSRKLIVQQLMNRVFVSIT